MTEIAAANRTIVLSELDGVMMEALPELRSDLEGYRLLKTQDAEFNQTFFSYSFVPTLQSALDQVVDDFCRRAFALIEILLLRGDKETRNLLEEEFFGYGPHCETWMSRALRYMGPQTLARAAQNSKHPDA